MVVLAYLGILAVIPLVAEKEDSEVQWHARHGLILLLAWIGIGFALAVFQAVPFVGWILGCAVFPFWAVLILVVHIMAIVKGLRGDRLMVPYLSEFVERWP